MVKMVTIRARVGGEEVRCGVGLRGASPPRDDHNGIDRAKP